MRQLSDQSGLNLPMKITYFALFSLFLVINAALAAETSPKTQLANPASVACMKNGGELRIEKDSAGNETGWCYWQSGLKCEEWAFFRGECPAKSSKKPAKLKQNLKSVK